MEKKSTSSVFHLMPLALLLALCTQCSAQVTTTCYSDYDCNSASTLTNCVVGPGVCCSFYENCLSVGFTRGFTYTEAYIGLAYAICPASGLSGTGIVSCWNAHDDTVPITGAIWYD